jgi:hypothetical protein
MPPADSPESVATIESSQAELPTSQDGELVVASAAPSASSPPEPTSAGVGGGIAVETEAGVQAHSSERAERGDGTDPPEDGGEPSWVECFHELRDELWVDRPALNEIVEPIGISPKSASGADALISCGAHKDGDDSPAGECYQSCGSSSSTATPGSVRVPSVLEVGTHGLVLLGNFDVTASQVPVSARITFANEAHGDSSSSTSSGPSHVSLEAVPAIWNPRFADKVTGHLAVDTEHNLGSLEWRFGKKDAVVVLFRSAIQRSPATPDWAAAVWLCHDAGARAAIIVNDLLDDGPTQPAFRMGLFGSPPPPIAAFMISGRDSSQLCRASQKISGTLEVTAQSVRPSAMPSTSEGDPETSAIFPWPLVLRMSQDVAQAWSLIETVHRASPSAELARRLGSLAERMGLPEKRVWLTRRLQRLHRGTTDSDDFEEPHLAFVECDRHGEQLHQLRCQLVERTGICAADIAGEFEVRFKDESSVGSAVMREWMDIIAQKAFLPAGNHLLISQDHGKTFLLDPAAPFLNRCWTGDFELLGRLLGLAMWHQVTLDLPLHPYICKLLLHYDEEFQDKERNFEEDLAELSRIDADLCKNKVQWLLSNDISVLGYDMPFADLLCSKSEDDSAAEFDLDSPALLEEIRPAEALPGDEQVAAPLRLKRFLRTQVLLAKEGEESIVTEDNKMEFVRRLLRWRLHDSLYGPITAMLRGVHAAVPPEVLTEARRMLTPDELCALLAGSRDIQVDDWQRNTRTAGGLTPNHQEVKWFWKTLRSWATDGRQHLLQNLLQFATGSRRVPVGGFAQLVGFNGGKHLFTLAKGAHLTATSLPTSHACICTVDLPPWESAEVASQKLLAAAEAGNARFDEGRAHEE